MSQQAASTTHPDAIQGLSEREAVERRARGLGNDVALETSRSVGQILRENVFTFINNTLFGLGIVLVLLGRVSDALVSVGVILVNVIVSVVQEVRAKQTLDRIALLTRPKAAVIRDGQRRVVDPSEIVVGDVLVVEPGDQIVVDGQIVGDGRIDVDESLLTGESDLIPKRAGDPVYSGSFAVTGQALYEARKVGADSVASKLTAGARAYRRILTPLQQEINLVIRVLLLCVIFFEVLLVAGAVVNGIPLVEGVRMSVVIAGLVPNGLFLAIAVAYAVGAVRMVGQGALVQQANAVESLSNVNVLCLDKTGTLTANRIVLEAIRPLGGHDEAEARRLLGDFAASTEAGNRTSAAIAEACPGQARRVVEAVPFSSARKWSALAFDDPFGRGVSVLGAPEMLAPVLAPDADRDATIRAWAEQGLRVLLFLASSTPSPLHDAAGQPKLPADLEPLAVVSFSDELRPEAQTTLGDFARAGIRLKIISGDNPETVAALAKQAGLGPEITLVSGLELAAMDAAQFAQAAEEATVFGRITPQQKEALVQALRARGHYVAMIGDGVNDVLSLKKANLGVAMQSGSQATRAVADIVLVRDSFAALPAAVREGQRILNGMQDILKLFLTRVFYVILLLIATAIVGGFPFTPKHNSLLALLTVGIPTIALAAWARPGPRKWKSPLRSLFHFVLPASVLIALFGLGVYLVHMVLALPTGLAGAGAADPAALEAALAQGQTALATFSVLCGIVLIIFAEPPTEALVGGDEISGDWRPTVLAAGLLAVFATIIAVPALRDFFELALLPLWTYPALVLLVVIWAVVLRFAWRTRLFDRFLSIDLS